MLVQTIPATSPLSGAVLNLLKSAHTIDPELEMLQIQGLAHAGRAAGFGIVLYVARCETVQAQVPINPPTHSHTHQLYSLTHSLTHSLSLQTDAVRPK